MSFLTKYGTLWGAIPQTAGRVFWVAPSASYTVEGRSYVASDGQDGLAPDRAVLTLDYAVGLCSANVGDVIVLLPGAHSWSASVAVDVAGITITGLPGGAGNYLRQRASVTTSAADEIMNVTAANVEIAYLHVIPATTKAGIDFSANADNLHVHDCSFDMATPAVDTGTIGLDATGGASNVLIRNNYFECDGAQGPAIDVTGCLDSVVEDNTFNLSANTWAAAITTGAATARVVIRRNLFNDGAGTITAGIDGTGATIANGVVIHDNRFGVTVTVPVDNFDAAEAVISENYDFGVGATDGGVLITAIT